MFKEKIKNYALVIAGLLFVLASYAQVTPVADYTTLVGGVGTPISGSSVCPSVPGFSSTNIFSVHANTTDAGDYEKYQFEWIVYGGTIQNSGFAGSIVSGITTTPQGGGINFSYVKLEGVGGTSNDSSIVTIQWDAVNNLDAWVAVRQFSEWSCSDSTWSVYTQKLINVASVFTSFPPDINIPNNFAAGALGTGFILVVPGVKWNDGCYTDLQTLTWRVENPKGNSIGTGTDVNKSITLVQDTNWVIWSAFDGYYTVVDTQLIIVEPEFDILNVAWTSAICGVDNGSAMVTNITSLPANGNRTVQYNFNSTGWVVSPSRINLAPGVPHTVQSRLSYVDNFNSPYFKNTLYQESPTYTFTLAASAEFAIDKIPNPVTNPTDITLVPTNCGNTDDGQIQMDPDAMNALNNSLTFDGVNDYLLLSKKYEGTIEAFTVAAWIKSSSNNGTIVSFDNNQYFQLGISGGQLRLTTSSTDNVSNTVLVDNYSYVAADGAWHLVAATFYGGGYSLYHDGIMVKTAIHNGDPSIGKTGETFNRFGAIGAVLKSNTFEPLGQANFFKGSIAEVGIWDRALSPAEMVQMKRNGMMNVGALTDHWALNNIPTNVSSTNPGVFSDVANTMGTGTYARFYNGPGLDADAPKLFSWDDDITAVTEDRTGLNSSDSYGFNVSDIFGCGLREASFIIPNGDDSDPELFWNVSVNKTASQSSILNTTNCDGILMNANMAIDGDLDVLCSFTTTNATLEPANKAWWQVNLGNAYPVNRVLIHPKTALSNFYVLVSSSDFTGTTLVEDIAQSVAVYVLDLIPAGGSSSIVLPYNTSGNFVRIRSNVDGVALSLAEVQVLTNYKPASIRKLFLSDDCNYTIDEYDATVDPVPYDACGITPTITYVLSGPVNGNGASLLGQEWPMGLYTALWTATDENGNTTTLTMRYDVVDEEPPHFVSNPFAGAPFGDPTTNITWCDAQTFTFPIPSVTDNYHHCDNMKSITLLRGSTPVFTVSNMATYDFNNPGQTNPLPSSLLAGTHVFTWRVIDANNNTSTVSHTITIQQQPILREVKYSPITCNGLNNGMVYFSKVEVEPSSSVKYILKRTSDAVEFEKDDINWFSVGALPAQDIPHGFTYQAFIEVDGCRTPTPYFEDIVAVNPPPITTVNDITDVICFGNTDGAIDISPNGGSQSYALHLKGYTAAAPNLTFASAPTYPAVQLTNSGMIEAWVFIDTIATGGVNYNAGIFGMPNGGNGYGFRVLNGALNFYVGAQSLTVTPALITDIQRTWIYLRGEWNGSDADGHTPRIYFETSVGTAGPNNPTAFAATPGGNIYMGSLNDGNDDHNLRGFVRFARVWNNVIDAATIAQNLYLPTPIDPLGTALVANYSMSAGTTTTIITNSKNTEANGTVTGNYARQRFAYYWLDPAGNYISNEQDISGYSAGIYNVTLYDPLGCVQSFDIEIETDDNIAPTLTFYTDHLRTNTLPVGAPIIRYTSQADGGNTANNCVYIPYDNEFNPTITDGTCDISYVTITYAITTPIPDGYDTFADSPADPNLTTLDGREMTGIMLITWTATDGKNTSTNDILYYIVDDTPPTVPDPVLSYAPVEMPIDGCLYRVSDGEFDPDMSIYDNCATGILTNDLNGLSSLDNYNLGLGTHTVTWTYTDREYPNSGFTPNTMTFSHNIVVQDNTPPSLTCVGSLGNTYLDDYGEATVIASDLLVAVNDNCSASTPTLVVTKNIAAGMAGSVSQSSNAATECELGSGNYGEAANAVDNNIDASYSNCSVALTGADVNTDPNPYWQINFGELKNIFGVQLYAGSEQALTNFWIVISTDGTFTPPADFSTPTWSADVLYAEHITSPIAVNRLFTFDQVVKGQYVRIWKDETLPLCLTEVEVYGAVTPSESVGLTCVDARYTTNANPRTGGNPQTITLLLSAIDNSGNVFSCNNNVMLLDDIDPQVIAVNLDVSPDEDGVVSFDPWLLAGASEDNCEIADIWTDNVLTCDDKGAQNITINVMDEFGNISSDLVTINVKDITKPIARARATVVIELDDQGQFTITDPRAFLEGTIAAEISTDNCGEIVSAEVVPNSFVCDDVNLGIINLIYTVRDANNNVSNPFTIQATVVDNLPPSPSIQNYNLTLTKPTDGPSIIFVGDFDAGGFDNCGLQQIGLYFDTDSPDNMCTAYTIDDYDINAAVSLPRASTATVTKNPNYNDYTAAYSLSNIKDAAGTSTAHATELTTAGTARTIEMSFPQQYYVSQTTVNGYAKQLVSETAISTNRTYLRTSPMDISTNVSTSNLIRLVDNSTANSYSTGITIRYNVTIEYNFTQAMVFTRSVIRWTDSPVTNSAVIWYYNETTLSWVWLGNIGTATGADRELNFDDVVARRIRIVFDLRTNWRGTVQKADIREWFVYGYPASSNNIIAPNNIQVQYKNTPGGITTWTNLGDGNMEPESVGSLRYIEEPGSVQVSDLRISFSNTTRNGYLGISDWQVWGSAGASTCREWTCNDVGPHTAHIAYITKSGQTLVVDKPFQVLPYFTITDVQLKDCAVSGEQYWSWVSNQPDNYSYCWQQQNYREINARYSYYDSNGNWVNNQQINNAGDLLQDRNTGSSTETTDATYAARGRQICYTNDSIAYVRVSRPIASGDYTIGLTLTDTDNPGCTSYFERDFTWDMNNGGGAQTIKNWEVCKSSDCSPTSTETNTFDLSLVVRNSYYGCFSANETGSTCTSKLPISYNWINHRPSMSWRTDQGMTKISGGGVADEFIEVCFPTARATPYEVIGIVGGVQRYVYYGSDASATDQPTMYVPAARTYLNCSNGCYDFGANFVGPFNLSDATVIRSSTVTLQNPNSVSAVNYNTSNPLGRCYDNNNGTYHITDVNGAAGSVTYTYTNPIDVGYIRLYWSQSSSNNSGERRAPATASIQFFNGTVWSAATTVSTTPNAYQDIYITASGVTQIRLNFTAQNNRRVAVAEFQVNKFNVNSYDIGGKNVVRAYTGSNYAPCEEGVTNRVTVLEVATPVIEGEIAGICPFEQITYTLPEPTPDPDPANLTYSNYKWTIIGGRKVSGGGGSDNTVVVEWNLDGWPTTQPRIELEVTNELGCKADDGWDIAYDQTTGITVSCPADAQYNAIVGTCEYLYLSKVKATVTMPNGCPYETLECSTDGGVTWKADASNTTFGLDGSTTGSQEHEIIWRAKDYFWTEANPDGHVAQCIQTITVVDNEKPRFVGSSLSNISLDTPNSDNISTTCNIIFPAATRDAEAEDGGDCTPVDDLVFNYDVDFNNNTIWDLEDQTGNSITGIEFPVGVSKVRYTVVDNAGNDRDAEFLVTVRDRTKPQILSGIDPITTTTDPDSDEATVTITTPSDVNLWDNCSDVANLTVTGTRDDGRLLNDTYPVGVTTITWIVKDEATPANSNSYTQTVTVSDNQAPEFRDNGTFLVDEEFADSSISYCARLNFRIPIPRTYWDNVQVEKLTYSVENTTTNTIVLSGDILHSVSPNFTVGGIAKLAAFTFPNADDLNGSTYRVTWTITDGALPTPLTSDPESYLIHVEMAPRFNHVTTTPIDCGGDAATITVSARENNTNITPLPDDQIYFRYDRDYDYTPEYSIGAGWFPSNTFTVSGGGTYAVRMRVNGCVSTDVVSTTIVAPVPYAITTNVQNHASCPESSDAEVRVSMSGGVPGQPVFTVGTQYFAAADYGKIDLSTAGAVEAWVYLSDLGPSTIVNKGTSYGLRVNASQQFEFFVGANNVASSYPIASYRWYHVSGWWNASGMNIMIDGETLYNNSTSVTAISNYDAFVIGSTDFLGIIREVRIWNLTVAGAAFLNGAIHSTKFNGDEDGLVAYWDMSEGAGNAVNKCLSFGEGTPAVPSTTAIWQANRPQPGFYNWVKNTNTITIPSNSSNIRVNGLGIGTYTVSFVDHYGCAATATSFKEVIAIDNQLPDFDYSAMFTTPIPVDYGVCTYTFDESARVTEYIPIISDADFGACEFVTNWRVVNNATGSLLFNHSTPGGETDAALLGAILENVGANGLNTVYVTVSQNGLDNFGEPEKYTINVVDTQKPTPDGRFDEGIALELDNTPNGGGQVTYTAAAFNRGSDDNCTKDPELLQPKLAAPTPEQIISGTFNPNEPLDPLWLDEVSFGCGAIGNTVKLYFQVTDESGNWNWITDDAVFDVKDLHAPVFLKTSSTVPAVCANVNADGFGTPAYIKSDDYLVDLANSNALLLLPAHYTDNCTINEVRFKLNNLDYAAPYNNDYNAFGYAPNSTASNAAIYANGDPIIFYEGRTEVTFRLTDQSGNVTEQLIYTIIVLPKPDPGDGLGGGIE